MDCRNQEGRFLISMPVVRWDGHPQVAPRPKPGKPDFPPAYPTLLTGARLAGRRSFGPCECGAGGGFPPTKYQVRSKEQIPQLERMGGWPGKAIGLHNSSSRNTWLECSSIGPQSSESPRTSAMRVQASFGRFLHQTLNPAPVLTPMSDSTSQLHPHSGPFGLSRTWLAWYT